MSTSALAIIILLVIFAQVAIVVAIGLYRRKQQYKKLSDQTNEIPINAAPPEPGFSTAKPDNSILSWDGFKEFVVDRREIEDKSQSVCSFYLVPEDGKPLATFKPGQFLTFKLLISDQDKANSRSVVRCYSLSDAHRTDYYRVSIKRVPAPSGQPDILPGISSNFFHDHVQPGSRLMVKVPSGHFHLMDREDLPVVLIGGGIGITPMLSMLSCLLENAGTREVWLYYGVRNGDEHIMKQQLQALDKMHDNFHLQVCYSAPGKNDIKDSDYQHNGRIDVSLLRATLKLAHYQFYVCGPKQMMETLIPELEDWGVSSNDIYYESFGPASLVRHEKTRSQASTLQPITVTFSKSGKRIPWDFAADSLLEFAENNGIDVDSGCRAGSCGSCQTSLSEGDIELSQQPDADVDSGHCLLCISTPKNDITLEA